MSTLAKVVKKQAGASFLPYSVPDIGDIHQSIGEEPGFSFPIAEFPKPVESAVDQFIGLDPEMTEVEIIKAAQSEAARIIADAEKSQELIEQAAREKGMQFVKNAVDAEVELQVSEMRENLAETIQQIAGLNAKITDGAETQLVELAIEIAKKVVQREVTMDREIAMTLVKVSLKRLNSRTAARVHLNPDDFAFVQSHRDKLDFHGALEFIEDKSISTGGCLIRTDTGDIDARIESQFEEIAHGLLGS